MRNISTATLIALLGAANIHAASPRRHVHKRQNTATPAVSGVPALASISVGMPSGPVLSATTTYAAKATPPVSGAPGLPTPFVFSTSDWPAQDHVPQTDSDEVAEWLKELDGFNIPDLRPTTDGSCVNDTAAAADAAKRGWWTCGGFTRPTDIVSCPDKFTWGVSFDDGPAPYTQTLLKYLNDKNIRATFFVVGSRVIERPNVLIEEYMAGNEVSVHTWSHRPLTSLTTAQVVAELGWTRHAIRKVLGVTPTTMRPPFGDIDDRVRAISMAMGLIPILWTRVPSGGQFDTNDWKVAAGQVPATVSYSTFQNILSNATALDTGFIVLQHDLTEITVDLAVGYTLNAALTHNPPFNLQPIGQCAKIPTSNLYFESNTNTSFPYMNHTGEGGYDIDGDGAIDTGKGANGATLIRPVSILTLLLAGGVGALFTLI